MDFIKELVTEFKIKETQVENTVKLIDDGNTIPFIARYRKELTGALDDQVLRELADRLNYLRNLEKRKQEVISSIDSQGKMTDEITLALSKAITLAEVEDIYRPYKQKRKTRASIAKEKGLEPLADFIFAQQKGSSDVFAEAEKYVDSEKGVETAEDAINGAKDIIAENISDDAEIRRLLRAFLIATANINSVKAKAGEDEATSVYAMYYEYSEAVKKIPGHRVLALNRGEKEDCLKISIGVDTERALEIINKRNLTNENEQLTGLVKEAIADAYQRLIFPSLEREIRNFLSENASEQAMKVFSINLRHLLMQPPVKGNVTLGLDPAYRTGCKIAVVDETGKVLDTTVVYPTPPQNKVEEAKAKLKQLIAKHKVTTIAIGNGTASRESEMFVATLLKEIDTKLQYMVVSEAGASVYSASKLASEEFPEYDVSIRSAVSIARRLQDPLAELVKIDPKSIGVGQYQHDMPKNRLDEALNGVVEDCVNSVGVDLNTASPSLLSKIAGINATIAKNIVLYREQTGAFKSRKELLKVPKLGQKAFEQCAGFLRVSESKNFLDATAVHPESYDAAVKLLEVCGYTLDDVKNSKIGDIEVQIKGENGERIANEIGVGVLTLADIASELKKPGRDIRDECAKPLLKTDVLTLEDLREGMLLDGTVRNVIDFGAFIDIGVHDDGLVHISQLCDKYIKHPSEVVKVGDIVKVKVISIDLKKHRVGLTMKL